MADAQSFITLQNTINAETGQPEERKETIASALKSDIEADFLSKYQSKYAITATPDRLDDRYTIYPNQPLPQFNSKTAKAYTVLDDTNSERALYALICSTYLPVREKVVKTLKGNTYPHMVTLVTDGIVRISTLNEERYVIIYEQPKGKPLADIIAAQSQPFSDRYLNEKVITPLSTILNTLEGLGITHGCINPNTIYIGTTLTLGECASEPCGYGQDFHFEPINRIQASPAGKGNGHHSIDYHALGVLVALMKLRPKSLQDPDIDRFTRRLLREGSFLGIVGYADVSDEMGDLLRGTLNDSINDRWTYKQVKPWTSGKRFNLLTPTIPSISNRSFELGGVECQNLRHMGHAIHRSWEQSLGALKDGSLAKWIEQSTRRREISDYINRTVKAYASRGGKAINEMITRVLFVMDSAAPIRMKDASAHVDGFGSLFAEIYYQQNTEALNQIGDVIEQSIMSSWAESQRRNFNLEVSNDIQQIITQIDKSRLFMRTQGLGYGPERMLYELNPNLPCQSPILKGYYAATLTHLLIALDNIAGKKDRPDVPMDRHIAGFIAAKTGLIKDMAFSEYSAYPALVKHSGLIALKFMTQAQLKVPQITLSGLSAWVTTSFLDAIGTFHSATVRAQMCQALKNLAFSGQFTAIEDYLLSFDFATADTKGYIAATEQYATFTKKIHDLKNNELREYKAYILGSTIAKFISYAILLVLLLYFYYRE